MINCALARYRTKSNLHPIIRLDSLPNDPQSEIDIHSILDAKELISLIQSLPARYRMVFNLFVFEGYKHREIAEALGITEGTSKSNLSDARAVLQKALNLRNRLVNFNEA